MDVNPGSKYQLVVKMRYTLWVGSLPFNDLAATAARIRFCICRPLRRVVAFLSFSGSYGEGGALPREDPYPEGRSPRQKGHGQLLCFAVFFFFLIIISQWFASQAYVPFALFAAGNGFQEV